MIWDDTRIASARLALLFAIECNLVLKYQLSDSVFPDANTGQLKTSIQGKAVCLCVLVIDS